jgi:hypothetical protein
MRRALIGLMAAAEQLISPPDAQKAGKEPLAEVAPLHCDCVTRSVAARVRSPARLEQLWSRLQDYAGSYAPGVPDGQDRRICEVFPSPPSPPSRHIHNVCTIRSTSSFGDEPPLLLRFSSFSLPPLPSQTRLQHLLQNHSICIHSLIATASASNALIPPPQVLQEITELVVWGDQNSSRSNSDVSRLLPRRARPSFARFSASPPAVFRSRLPPAVFAQSNAHNFLFSCANGVVDMFLEPNPQMGKIPYKRGGYDAGAAERYKEPSRCSSAVLHAARVAWAPLSVLVVASPSRML